MSPIPQISFNQKQRDTLYELYYERAVTDLETTKKLREWTTVELEMAGMRKRQLEAELAHSKTKEGGELGAAENFPFAESDDVQPKPTENQVVHPSVHGAIAIFRMLQGLPLVPTVTQVEQINAVLQILERDTATDVRESRLENGIKKGLKEGKDRKGNSESIAEQGPEGKNAVMNGKEVVRSVDQRETENSSSAASHIPREQKTAIEKFRPANVAGKVSFKMDENLGVVSNSKTIKRKRDAAADFLDSLLDDDKEYEPPSPHEKRALSTPPPKSSSKSIPTGPANGRNSSSNRDEYHSHFSQERSDSMHVKGGAYGSQRTYHGRKASRD
ncbi:MAG: hypothetical protein MMC33_008604 [Icmadophila ericetorum]|nr:hypothetical protein [Icmadophila ericetorum]